ncbi:MAG: hypothetical protein WC222_02340 [Parachlamydiales bacterium]|jgi:hypothetical protein
MVDPLLFALHYENVWIVPVIHYNMETAAHVCKLFHQLKPDAVAVELAETLQEPLVKAAERLPDISIILSYSQKTQLICYLAEPTDPAFEGLRCALENGAAAYCIDLDVDFYPDVHELLPDPYAISRIGLESYWHAYNSLAINPPSAVRHDEMRETHMARRLKELSLRHDKVLCVCGMAHAARILGKLRSAVFAETVHAKREIFELCTLTEESCREILPEGGYISRSYEEARQKYLQNNTATFPLDRRLLLLNLYKTSAENYISQQKGSFQGYHLRNLMKFSRNYALIRNRLTPTLFQIITASKSCVDNNYAYETWKEATAYPYLKNIDNLPEIDLTPEDVWGNSQLIKFRLLQKSEKGSFFQRLRKDKKRYKIQPGFSGFCSFPPEDLSIENFGEFLKKKGTQLLTEEAAQTKPFSSSIEDGIDMRETIRHWAEKKLYVKSQGKPPGGVGSVVMIFDEDSPKENESFKEKYPWCVTWHGEHAQESDMAFYATPFGQEIIGPGIYRCEYGGFMLTYPPRRMMDIWTDPDYAPCRSKAEVLLAAAIDYSLSPTIVYVASSPPRPLLKSFASRFGKKVVYIPIGQLSPVTLNKLRKFHVLDGHDKRAIADEYIF